MRRLITPLIVLALLAVGLLTWRHYRGGPSPGPGPGGGGPPGGMQVPVEAMTVQPEPLARGLATVGTLRADESVVVRPEIAGRVVEIHFDEGQQVAAGAPLFTLDASVPRARLRQAEATLDNARQVSSRSAELAAGNLISRSELENSEAQLAVSQAQVASARAELRRMTLVAPFAGVVGLREVSVGAYVTAGQELVALVALNPMEVDFSLPERDLASVAVGQPVRVSVDAFAGQEFTGKLAAIEPTIDVQTRTAHLRASVANPDHKLRPGLFARIDLMVGDAAPALLVPEQALLQEGEARFVYRVVAGKAARTEVQTGQRVPGRVEIVTGLSAGDQVITAGQGKPMMRDGAPVAVVAPGVAAPSPAAPVAAAPAAAAPTAATPATTAPTARKPAAAKPTAADPPQD